MELVDALDQTFAQAQRVIAGTDASRYADKTPCEEWTVQDLLAHMIGVVAGMADAANARPQAEFTLGTDPAAQFKAAAAAALEGWRAPGILDRIIEFGPGPMPGRVLAGINLLDTATHTWDLATATGQPADLPDDVAEAALDASASIVSAELRPGRFAAAIPTPDGASHTERLVAFLGRTP
jgi:uncharacterized protein (TIGR03086 family)